MIAAGKGNMQVVEKFISAGANLDAVMSNGSTALIYAVGKGFVDVAKKACACWSFYESKG
jgi:ankyrin repeat protein